MTVDLRNTTTDLQYSNNEIARAVVEERLMKATKESQAKGSQVRRKLRDFTRGIFGG